MRSLAIAMITILLHMIVTGMLSVSYNVITEPFRPFRLLLDLAIFAALYLAVALCWSAVARLKER